MLSSRFASSSQHKAAITTASSTLALNFTSKRTAIYSTHVNKKLEKAATERSFEAPLWVDVNTVNRSLYKKNIRPRPNETPTTITVQQHVALYNLDQLGITGKGAEFVSSLPRGIKQPTDASNHQPFRGALQQQLEVISFNKKWGPWWMQASGVKFHGFIPPRDRPFEPSAWKTLTQAVSLWNLDQLESGSDVDLSTVPVNYRYGMFMLGTDLSEELRNEALRRNLKYPVVTTNKMVELVGCSILPESIDGFVLEKTAGYGGMYNNNNNGNNKNNTTPPSSSQNHDPRHILYNLDEFNVGADTIIKAMGLASPDTIAETPTFAQTGRPILRQLVLRDSAASSSSSNNNNDGGEKKQEEVNNDNKTDKTSPLLNKFTTNYWIRDWEARQFSDGAWKLKPDAVGAYLGESLFELRKQKELKDRAEADGSGDVTLNDNNNNTKNHQPQSRGGDGASQNPYFNPHGRSYEPKLNPYYFDSDVKERKEFLAGLGTYLL